MIDENLSVKPAVQAIRLIPSPRSGVVPPVEHRFQPGQSGNPAGSCQAGATIRHWWNVLAEKSAAEIERIVADKRTGAAKLAAARSILRAASSERRRSGRPMAGDDLDRILKHSAD